ncbi:hypothetical protein JOD50_000160 [Pseudoglutamicibacter cumminsii]|nr:hypothetical protein [Pseudoglutamicibacter cumminsii]
MLAVVGCPVGWYEAWSLTAYDAGMAETGPT